MKKVVKSLQGQGHAMSDAHHQIEVLHQQEEGFPSFGEKLNEIAFLFDSKVHILHIKTALMCKKKKPTAGAIIKWTLGSSKL